MGTAVKLDAQPIQPSTRRALAQQLSMLDPRCSWPDHNLISQGEVCRRCHLDLETYLDAIPSAWPA